MSNKLSDRILLYEESTSSKIIPKLPLIFKINGKGFSNATSLLDKPFDKSFYDCLASTMKMLCSEIEGAVLGYLYNDTIIIVSRNDNNIDTNPWFNNNVNKLVSVTASLATAHFNKCSTHISLGLTGLPLFLSNVYAVPNINEVINALIYYQQLNSLIAVQFACYYELIKHYDKQTLKKMMQGLSKLEKITLLQNYGIEFENYSSIFRNGALCVRSYNSNSKWELIENPAQFSINQDFLKDNINI